jgi:hypothetical protein
MLWFYDGTIPVLTWATSGAHEGRNAVKGRTYWGTIREDKLQAGLYQMIYDATPCLTYEFQMYVKAQMGEPNDVMYALKVGIDRRGFRPNTWAVGSFPSSTAWGAPRTDYVGFFGPLSVTAEAWDSTISVYTYAEAGGGNSVDFAWDTGSFRDATPPVIQDPDNLPPPGGIFNLSESVGSTTATISWETVDEALGQVYFRASPTEPIPPIGTNRVYLPIMIGPPVSWQWTPLNKTPTRYHTANLVDLLPGHTYEYIAVSRGLSGGQCVTWVSDVETFTTSN